MVSTVSYECFADWISVGPNGLRMGEALGCFASLVLTSVPLGIALIIMLRYAALVRSGSVAMLGGLAVAAVTSTALAIFHDLDATVMILVWNLWCGGVDHCARLPVWPTYARLGVVAAFVVVTPKTRSAEGQKASRAFVILLASGSRSCLVAAEVVRAPKLTWAGNGRRIIGATVHSHVGMRSACRLLRSCRSACGRANTPPVIAH